MAKTATKKKAKRFSDKAGSNGSAQQTGESTDGLILESTSDLTYVDVRLKGLPPGLLFQGKGLMEHNEGKTKVEQKAPAAEEAMYRAHWMGEIGNSHLCIPWIMLYRSFCQAGSDFKWEVNKRKAMSNVIGANLACTVDKISLGTPEFEVYEVYCRIPPNKKDSPMVKIGRPLLREWEADFTITIDGSQVRADVVAKIMQHAGKTVGIGAFRPGLRGPYGKFVLTKFDIQ